MFNDKSYSLKSYFLVANISLNQSYFSESVILVLEHSALSAFGLVLNRIERRRNFFYQLLDSVDHHNQEYHDFEALPLYEGGPINQENIFMLHDNVTMKNPGREAAPGIFCGSGVKFLQKLIDCPYSFNLYRGYAGWGPGQLEQEIYNKNWIILPISDEIIFHSEAASAWKKTLNLRGGLYSYFANNVRDPILN